MSDPTSITVTPENREEILSAPKQDQAPDGTPPADQGKPEETKLILGKYKTYEELEKAHEELQRKLGQPSQKVGDDTKKDSEESGQKPPEGDKSAEAREAVENAGLNFDAYAKEFADNGKLSDATYEALEKNGIPKDLVDQYIAGQTALADAEASRVFNLAGGEAEYRAMCRWAMQNLSKQEIAAFDAAVTSGDPALATLAVNGLKAQYTNVHGIKPSTVVLGDTSVDTLGDVFRSRAEVTTAMKDPRYKTDEAYRRDVANKLARSKVF